VSGEGLIKAAQAVVGSLGKSVIYTTQEILKILDGKL